MPLQVISLFSGAGGMDRGFRARGFESVLALDNCPDAVRTYNHNLPGDCAHEANLATLTPEKMLALIPNDAHPIGLIGGPPCQGFSRGNVATDPSDPRNLLPYRYADLLAAATQHFGLHFFVFENVVGLARQKHATRFGRITKRLENAGFRVFKAELDAGGFGVPQRRLRLFLVGLNRDIYPTVNFQFPEPASERRHVRDAIAGLPAPIYFRRDILPQDIPFHPNHWTMMPKSPKFSSAAAATGRSFKRLDWDAVSPTVAYGHREIHVHPEGGRRLSIYEAMLLQGFPPEYQLTGCLSSQVTQVSNAVPPPMAEAIAGALLRHLLIPNDAVRAGGAVVAATLHAPCAAQGAPLDH